MLTEKQKALRKNGIGGSDAGAVLGLSPYKDATAVYLEKAGHFPAPDLGSEFLSPCYLGNKMEPIIAQCYEDYTSSKISADTQTYYHSDFPFLMGHVDYLSEDKKTIIECKYSLGRNSQIWGDTNLVEIPKHYYAQVQHYLSITGLKKAQIAVLIGGYNTEFKLYDVERNDKFITYMNQILCEFWTENVLKDVPPKPTTIKSASLLWPKEDKEQAVASSKDIDVAVELARTIDSLKELEKSKSHLQLNLKNSIQDHDSLVYQDQTIASWKANKSGSRVFRFNSNFII